MTGLHCLANFWHCRETHHVVTGPGWSLAGMLALAAAALDSPLPWHRVGTQAAVFVVVLAAGVALEWAAGARTGRKTLGGGERAEDP